MKPRSLPWYPRSTTGPLGIDGMLVTMSEQRYKRWMLLVLESRVPEIIILYRSLGTNELYTDFYCLPFASSINGYRHAFF